MFVRPKAPKKLNLTESDLSGADLSEANLSRANLSRADLSEANLSRANLPGANLSGANLSGANLSGANLSGANLPWANLPGANLPGANLSRANLSRANLPWANLSGANLSQCKGLPVSPHVFLETCADGVIAYRAFGNTTYDMPEHWRIEPGAVIEEPGCNPDRFSECGSGVNVASTLDWVKSQYPAAESYWRVLIKWADLSNTVVPLDSDGKYRTIRITLLEKVS